MVNDLNIIVYIYLFIHLLMYSINLILGHAIFRQIHLPLSEASFGCVEMV